jgi:pilus assembly protein CpaE
MSVQRPTDRIQVLIVDDVAETRENLRKLLSFDPEIEVVGAASTGEQGIQLAKETKPHVILMDINLPGMDGIAATEQIVRQVPSAQIVILSVQSETGYMRRAMAAGARDFLVKPPSTDELVGAIHHAFEIGKEQAARVAPARTTVAAGPKAPRPTQRGNLVTVFAPTGGVGCTTVAINLAIALQKRLGIEKKVALVDGSFQFGDAAVMLNLQSNRSIADLSTRLQELDPDMLTSAMTPHASGIKVLLCPPHPEAADALWASEPGTPESPGQKLRTIINALLRSFDLVVADTWSRIDDITLSMFDEATLILAVLTPVIPAIKSTRLFMDVAFKLGYPPDKVGLVVNHADRRTGLRVDQIEKALTPAMSHIPYDERAGFSAANRGIPLALDERTRTFAQAFDRLAHSVQERVAQLTVVVEDVAEDEWGSAEVSRRLLGRVLGD